ncbi:DUF7379 domain-containing protein [Cryptosporangium phraense]|uniref:DUF7379 domain-containing protein n=1 Tax=Cryptosporangium phraense TaxID=2593070 RepID=A0A545AYN7_9ACTN|nr:hypothetical protein [Cryptosporangium phraense]TQS46443.1 hypothetical protein FL583_03375 [Cryptosporangium phraense]
MSILVILGYGWCGEDGSTVPELERDGEVEMPYGVRLRSVGLSATVDVRPAATAGAPVRAVAPGGLTAVLAESDGVGEKLGPVVEAAGMRPVLTVPMEDVTVAPGASGLARGITDESAYVEMSVPSPDPDEGQVVLEVDAAGLMRWHVDVDTLATAAAIADGGPPPAATLGVAPTRGGLDQVFRIPVEPQTEDPGTGDGRRGLLGIGIRKVLHLIRFPIESAAAAAGQVAVGWWEDRNRPHALRLLTPDDVGSVPEPGGVDATRLAELADQPFLVLVHGTFSTIRGGFDGLSRPGVGGPGLPELIARYDGRVLGFDHPTLHVDPAVNASWFLDRLPRDRPVTLDLLTHSRGGLVGRQIADPDVAAAAGVPAPDVRRLIHVGTPNNGTVLASPKRWTTLIDVFSNLFSLLPDEPATATVQAVIELVKQIATGVFSGLSGLTAMDPGNPAVAAANRSFGAGAQGRAGAVRAIASDFTPAGGNLKLAALNALVDPFFGAGNDLVVPTQGVYDADAYRVSDPYLVPSADAVVHTAFFSDPQVRAKLGEWLPGSAG